MKKDIAAPFIPVQSEGAQTDTSESIIAPDEETAKSWFDIACLRLQDVNHWNKWCGFLSSGFQLTDTQERSLATTAHAGQYIRINIPGPGTRAGNGYDWVRIERVEHIRLNEVQEIFIIQARPSTHPLKPEGDIAHFLDSRATSSFVIKRDATQLAATVYGRNEMPNTTVGDTVDKLRNAMVGSSGAIGVSKLQWKALVKGLFEFIREPILISH